MAVAAAEASRRDQLRAEQSSNMTSAPAAVVFVERQAAHYIP
jgi:hypothetical protein